MKDSILQSCSKVWYFATTSWSWLQQTSSRWLTNVTEVLSPFLLIWWLPYNVVSLKWNNGASKKKKFSFWNETKVAKNQHFHFEIRQRCLTNINKKGEIMFLKWVRHECLKNKMTLQSQCLRHAKTIVFRANKNALKSPFKNCDHKSKKAGLATS